MYQAPPPTTSTGCTCPVCGQQAMSLFTRLTWKMNQTVTCRSCRSELRLSFAPWLIALWCSFFVLPLGMVIIPGMHEAVFRNLWLVIPPLQAVGLTFVWLGYRYGRIRAR